MILRCLTFARWVLLRLAPQEYLQYKCLVEDAEVDQEDEELERLYRSVDKEASSSSSSSSESDKKNKKKKKKKTGKKNGKDKDKEPKPKKTTTKKEKGKKERQNLKVCILLWFAIIK